MIPALKLDHLLRMTDDVGLFQFAIFSTPNKEYGYTLDDNARALIVCICMLKNNDTKQIRDLIQIYFNFIKRCFQKNGTFINYIGYDGKPTKQNSLENLEDARGRALWALSEMMNCKLLPSNLISDAKKIFLQGFKKGSKLTHLKAQAFAIKAFALAVNSLPKYKEELLDNIKIGSDSLLKSFNGHSHSSWNWFEDHVTYSIGLLPESMLIAGAILNKKEYTRVGLLSLTFLIDTTFSEGIYHPIGNSYWYKHSQKRSYYDQQPEDPASMILCLVRAYNYTHKEKYKNLAIICFSWYLRNNSLQIPLYNEASGGCYDGLMPSGVNLNQGAESLISYLMAREVIQPFYEKITI